MAKHLKNPTPAEIDALIDSGYRRVSRRHGLVARIDREDWVSFLAGKGHAVGDRLLRPGYWEDFYRRNYSKDQVRLHPTTAERVPCSHGDPVGYMACNRLHEAAA